MTLEDPVVVEVAVEDPVVVVLTPPLTLAPVDAPTFVTELVAAVERVAVVVMPAEAVVVAGFAAAPAVDDDDDAVPFCNVDIKPPSLTKFACPKSTIILLNAVKWPSKDAAPGKSEMYPHGSKGIRLPQ